MNETAHMAFSMAQDNCTKWVMLRERFDAPKS